MGLSIYCKKTKTNYDLGCGGFYNLRLKVAELCSPEFGEHYKTLLYLHSNKEYADFDKKTLELINNKAVSKKVVDFCLQSDIEGSIRYGACKEIYNHIEDYDDNICYGYLGRPNRFMFKDFKDLLKECYDNKSSLCWD